ncbi:hypothetical protein EVAR_35821_1 [Eumeta japonica]|uniref:Uncharacterized protein n=1 Tax=Eumeta variegata TaxID=151549 RepID=A0A4C1WZR6_EUMVA|nr:hypothetical protein EVAR_35821_1 [Eumeta japonica]
MGCGACGPSDSRRLRCPCLRHSQDTRSFRDVTSTLPASFDEGGSELIAGEMTVVSHRFEPTGREGECGPMEGIYDSNACYKRFSEGRPRKPQTGQAGGIFKKGQNARNRQI